MRFYHAKKVKYNLIFMLAFAVIAIFYENHPNFSLFMMFTAGFHFGCLVMKFGSDEVRKKFEEDL